jgi:hypothetical protein
MFSALPPQAAVPYRSIALAGSRAEVRVPLLFGRYGELHSQRSSAGVGRLRLVIPIGHLYFREIFHLGKRSLNDDSHSKPITIANGECVGNGSTALHGSPPAYGFLGRRINGTDFITPMLVGLFRSEHSN